MTPANNRMKDEIQRVIKELMDRVIEKTLITDPFLKDKHRAEKPLYAALVPDEIFKGAHFERRFVTPFGTVWEKLAIVAARAGLGYGEPRYTITGNINKERLRRVNEVINKLEHPTQGQGRTRPDWDTELHFILEGRSNEIVPTTVICDVYAQDTTSEMTYAFELKAPLPNSDQTKVSKEKILKLYCMDPKKVDAAYYALPYNPYGARQNYSWSFPARWFNMREDEVVLIGDEFWEKIGGAGTYQAFIEAVNEIGIEYKEVIYRKYLGIEPPESAHEGFL